MKITCQACQAKYTIADEKVVGKTVKIKCRKCGATIVVHGTDGDPLASGPGSQPPMSAAPPVDEDQQTHIYSGPGGTNQGGADEWTVNVHDEEQRTMTTAQIAAEYQSGVVNRDTYVWRDGMGDWLPLGDVPDLLAACESSQAVAPPPSSAPTSGRGAGATAVMGTMPMSLGIPGAGGLAATPNAPAAARRAGARGGSVDLFGSSALQQREAPAPAPVAAPPLDKHVGERNENSVLFSLSALTAAETAAKAAADRGDAVIDMRRGPSSPTANNGRAGIDDILNLGGGMGSPVLAPPPLLAPVIEAPPPPSSVASAFGSANQPFLVPSMQPKRSAPIGLIVGIGGGVAIAAIVGFFALRGPSTSDGTSTAEQASSAPTAPTAAAADTSAAANTAPTDTAAPTASPTATAVAAVKPGERPAAGAKADRSSDRTDKKDDTSAPPPPPKPDKPAETSAPAPAAAGGQEFNRGAASSALGAAAASAKSCKKGDGPTGSGRVKVTFAPSGNVTSAVVEGSLAGTSVGGCVAGAFRGAHVPPFDGAPVVVSKSFTIN